MRPKTYPSDTRTLSDTDKYIYIEDNQEENNMSNRQVVTVQLIDDDKGLEVENSIVAVFKDVVTEDDNQTTIQELIMNSDVHGMLEKHNEKRGNTVNQEVLERTGNEVNLRPVKLKNLRWVIK